MKSSRHNGTSQLSGIRILIVDDDASIRKLIASEIHRAGAEVDTAASGEAALELTRSADYDLIIADVKMPGMDGIELAKRLKSEKPEIETIIITGYGDIPLAVKAMRCGAYDFITKPFSHAGQIVTAAEKALEKKTLTREIQMLRSRASKVDRFELMVGSSHQMQRVYEWINKVAPTESTALIQGQTGAGKELVARAIHARSNRADGPFIVVNCGALTESLLESELFGHLKGAFTGAHSTKIGLFEAAARGTIFLDEINSTSPHTQLGLLRVLEDKQVRPVGSVSMKTVDARVIVSSQDDLFKLAEAGKFREDLYYRISSLVIALPPLRERIEDIPLLAGHFLDIFCKRISKRVEGFSPEAMELLTSHRWPGNVRELENVIEKAVLFSKRAIIERSDLSKFVRGRNSDGAGRKAVTLVENEREHILRILRSTGNNKVQTAKALGIQRSTLYKKMKRLGIEPDSVRGGLPEESHQ